MSEIQKSPWNIYDLKGMDFLQRLKEKTLTFRHAFFLLLLLFYISNSTGRMMVRSLLSLTAPRNTASELQSYGFGYGSMTNSDSVISSIPPPPPSDRFVASRLSKIATTDRTGGPNIVEVVPQDATGGAMAKAIPVDRRIIYTATVDLIAESLAKVEPKLLEMIKAAGGFISSTNQTGSTGGQRTATWRVRVPVTEYDGFLQKARTLGEVQSVVVNSQDVTEEFVDVSARISTKKVQEQRLIDLIKEHNKWVDPA